MAYTRENLLKKIIDIQEIYLNHSRKQDGVWTDKDIFEKLIKPVYHISRSTFYFYIGCNAKRELTQLYEARQQQPSLFDLSFT